MRFGEDGPGILKDVEVPFKAMGIVEVLVWVSTVEADSPYSCSSSLRPMLT
jgi:hypothetical protein